MYCNVICTGERVEFHIFGGMHISGLVRAKRMGISLECSKYAYFVWLWKNQRANVLWRKNMNINTFHSPPYKLHCKSQWNLYLAYFDKLALKPFGGGLMSVVCRSTRQEIYAISMSPTKTDRNRQKPTKTDKKM